MRRIRCAFALTCLALACSTKPSPRAPSGTDSTLPAAPVAGPASAAAAAPRERPELGQAFAAEGVKGTIALFDTADGVLSCSDVARCSKAVLPASTFKIANSIIALETGVVDDAETLLPWDGKEYQVPAWNQDHTLRTAMRVSCFPCFRDIARKIGPERMSEWLGRLAYGNRDMSGGSDRFWLFGGLRISPLEQLDFLRRLEGNKLPISERTTEIVRDLLTLDVGQNHVLRGKTGLATRPESQSLVAWFVGWLELGERRIFFATLIDDAPAEVDVIPLRRRVTERVLDELGLLPADRTREAPNRPQP